MNTMEATKTVAGFCGALFVLLFVRYFIAEPLFHVELEGEPAYLIEVAEAETPAAEEEPAEAIDYAALVAAADAAAGEKDFGKCRACHKIEADAHGTGPSLHAVVGRDVAGIAGFPYSDAMAAVEGEWTVERLAEFLHAPKTYVPRTKMAFNGFPDPADAANMAAYLATLN